MSPPPRRPIDPVLDPSRGANLSAQPPLGRERAVILTVDAQRHAYRVVTASGRTFTVGRLKSSPGDNALLAPHTPVRIDYSLGEPYIDGILPTEVPLTNEVSQTLTGAAGHGGSDSVLNRNLGASFRGPGEPNDLIPGDQAIRSPDGASVAALHGKVAQVFGSPMAQMRAFGSSDSVEVIAGLLRFVTWMGESKYVNEDGKTSFIWRGGSDQLTETGADEERYTLRLDVGHRGNLFKFEVTTPDGQPVFRLHVSPEGRLSILAAEGVNTIAGRESASRITDSVQGAREVVTEGSLTSRVAGDANERFQGNRQTSVAGQDLQISLADRAVRVNRQLNTSVGGNEVRNVGGTRTTTVVNNDETNVRGTADLNVTGTSSVTAPVHHVKSPSIKLGRNPNGNAVKFQQLQTALDLLNANLTALKLALRTHTHPVTLVPAPLAGPSPLLIGAPSMNPYTLNLAAARSTTTELE